MSKIGDFEQRLISDGMTDRDLEEYAKLLVRVRDKRQHCYTTAVKFPPERSEQAVKLIKFGLESFEDDGGTQTMRHIGAWVRYINRPEITKRLMKAICPP